MTRGQRPRQSFDSEKKLLEQKMKERWKENEQWEVEVDAEGEEDGTADAAGVKARDGEGAAARNGAEE